MSNVILPDRRFERPELFYPGRKPVGRVKIDQDHPLAAKFCHWSHITRDGIVDLATGAKPVIAAPIVSTPYGAATRNSNYGNRFTYSKDIFPVFKTQLGIYLKARMLLNSSAMPSAAVIDTTAINNSGFRIFFKNSLGIPRFRLFTANITTGTNLDVWGAWVAGDVISFVFRYDGWRMDTFRDATLVGSKTGVTGDVVPPSSDWVVGGALSESYSGSEIIDFAVTNQYITAAEIASLHRNPYQFLIPA